MFHVRLPDYAGPLDLLLATIERGERDPLSVAAADIAAQYLRFLRAQGGLEVDQLADAVPLIARLLQLKSAALLPRPAGTPPPEEPDQEPSLDLAELIREYRRFKAAAEEFRGREQEGLRSFPRLAPPPSLPPSLHLGNVTLDSLLAVVQDALRRRPPDPPDEVPRYTVTVRERLAALESELAGSGRVNFSRFIATCRTRIEIIVAFMAVLELIKNDRAAAEQPEPFGDILIVAQAAVAVPPD